MYVHPQNTSTMQARSWLFLPTQHLQDSTELGSITVPAYHPSLCLLFFTLLCTLVWGVQGGRNAALTSHAPSSSGFWLGLDKERYQQVRKPEERNRVFLPWFPPFRFMVWLHHPGQQSTSGSSSLSPWLPKSRPLFYLFYWYNPNS